MPAGRPSKPTELKRRQGTLRKSRLNKREPALPPGAPALPPELDKIAAAEWRRLVAEALRMRVLTESERGLLCIAAAAYSTWRRAEDALAEAGSLTYETTNTTGGAVIKARPECAIASDAWRRYYNAIVQLGMTPASRSKVSSIGEGEEEDPAAAFLN